MINFVISILIGLLPDVIYYTFNITNIKNVKKNRIKLFVMIFIIYLLLNMIVRYNFYLYIIFDILIYLSLKIIYKSKITDFFLVVSLDIYLLAISGLSYILFNNYFISLTIDKVFLLGTLLVTHKLRNTYKLYCDMWDRNRFKRMPIKSITLRNISITTVNISILIVYLVLLYLMSFM